MCETVGGHRPPLQFEALVSCCELPAGQLGHPRCAFKSFVICKGLLDDLSHIPPATNFTRGICDETMRQAFGPDLSLDVDKCCDHHYRHWLSRANRKHGYNPAAAMAAGNDSI